MTWAGSPAPQQQQLAGWWYRVGATIIDDLVLAIPVGLLAFTTGSLTGRVVIAFAVQVVYVTLMLSRLGQTVGMMALRTRVIDGRTGNNLTLGKAFGRALVAEVLGSFSALTGLSVAVSLLWRLLDDLWPLWDKQNQTLHDKAVGSLVVRTVSTYGTVTQPPATGAFGSPGQGWGTGPGDWGQPERGWGQAPAPQAPAGWGDQHGWAAGPSAASPGAEPAAASVPADWYPDPAGSGNERWWDGRSWTDHVRSPS